MDIGQLYAFTDKVPFVVDIPETEIFLLANDMILKLLQVGKDLFKLPFISSEPDSKPEDTANWHFATLEDKVDAMQKIILEVQKIFSNEPRIVSVS